jgi:hypothetical protein
MNSEAPRNADHSDADAGERGRVIQFVPRSAPKPAAVRKASAFANLSRDANLARDAHASAVPGLEKYSRDTGDQDDFSHRMKMNALAAIVLLALIGGGMWIVDVMTQMRQNQDCVLSGRRNCTTIAQPAGSRVP